MELRINIGCGQTPTLGWRNFDNSLSLCLSKFPILPDILLKLGLIDNPQYQFVQFARKNNIEYGDATKGLPFKDASVDVIYSSHMLEHLDRNEASRFINESFRLLRPGGIIRIAVPDFRKSVAIYNETGDADVCIEGTLLCVERPKSIVQRLGLLLVGTRHHQWLYDGRSLCKLLQKHGFIKAEVMPPGQTTIHDPQALDLHERASESVFVEAEKPITP